MRGHDYLLSNPFQFTNHSTVWHYIVQILTAHKITQNLAFKILTLYNHAENNVFCIYYSIQKHIKTGQLISTEWDMRKLLTRWEWTKRYITLLTVHFALKDKRKYCPEDKTGSTTSTALQHFIWLWSELRRECVHLYFRTLLNFTIPHWLLHLCELLNQRDVPSMTSSLQCGGVPEMHNLREAGSWVGLFSAVL
jgi:hypothetical protein